MKYGFVFEKNVQIKIMNRINGISSLINYRAKTGYVVEQTTFNFYKALYAMQTHNAVLQCTVNLSLITKL